MRLLIVLGLAVTQTGFAADDNSFFLRGATIHTMAGRDIPNGSVLVRDGKIVGVGEKLSAPRDIKIIEGKGLQVYPGMIDSASTVGVSEIGAVTESNDVTEIGEFDPQLRASVAVNPDSEHIPVTRANGITSVVVLPGSAARRGAGSPQLLSGSASLIRMDGWTTEDLEIKRTAAMHLHIPVINIGDDGRFGGEAAGRPHISYDQARRNFEREMQELNEFFEEARRYARAKAAKGPDFRTDLKMEAMLPVIEGKEPLLVTATRERAIRDAIAFSEKQQIRMILCDGREAYKVIPELKSHNIPVVLAPTLSLPLDEDDPYDQPATQPSELYKGGVKFAFATFSNEFSRNLPYQAAAAVGFGLPKEEAMKAITINAAQIWGVSGELGTIEEGKSADFMLVDGDPLETQTQVKQLFIRGKNVSLDNKQKRLYEKYKSRPE